MNHLHVSACYEPGHVEVSTLHSSIDGKPFGVVSLAELDGPILEVSFVELAQVDELSAALAVVREFLSTEAARDAA